ncbi:MAG: HAD-IA family hydrolase [Thermoplasmata archaeon]|nr:HAD-IA family hydrolase [Thermoplasmata archaeon]
MRREGRECRPDPGPPAAVFFDLDDTLFDHTGTVRGALRAVRGRSSVLHKISLERLLQRYLGLIEETYPEELAGRLSAVDSRSERFRRLVEEAGGRAGPTEAAELSAFYRETYQRSRREMPGAHKLLASYRKDGTQVGVITNNREEEQVEKLEFLGLASLVDHLVTSEAAGYAKPDPRIFQEGLRRAGVLPSEARMVGDSWAADILGAASAGLPAIWFDREAAEAPRTPQVPRIRSLAPVPSVRRRIASWRGSYLPRRGRIGGNRRPKE